MSDDTAPEAARLTADVVLIGDDDMGNDRLKNSDGIGGKGGADTPAEASRKAQELSANSYQSFHVIDRNGGPGAEYYQGKRV